MMYRRRKNLRYPWELMMLPGDYFEVPHNLRTFKEMKAAVSTHNSYYIGVTKFECQDLPSYNLCWVILIEKIFVDRPVILKRRAIVHSNGWDYLKV